MKLHQYDISQRRERDGRIALWLSERLLTDELGISAGYLATKARHEYAKTLTPSKRKKDYPPDTGASWRYAKIAGVFYYEYDRLPAERRQLLPGKEALIEQYETAMAQSSQAELEKQIRAITKNKHQSYLHHYAGYDYAKAQTLAKAAALVEWMAKEAQQQDSGNVCAWFKTLAGAMDSAGVAYIPRHWRRLKDKADAILSGQPVAQVVDLPRKGNTNALKFDDPELVSWLLQMRSLPQNYTNAFIIRKVRLMCELSEKTKPSKSWLESKLAEPLTKFLTVGRYGSGRLADRYSGYIPIQNALHAGDCWMADGTRVNMIGWTDENGREQFLYWVAITDVHSGDILGVHFDTKEDRWAYINAMNMAVQHAGYLPYEMVFDRFPGHNTGEIELLFNRMRSLGVEVTISSSKTDKSKLERLFETIQSVFMAESDWYYGEGVQSSRDSAHRAPEYIERQKKLRKDGWNFDEAYKEMMQVVERYRSTPLADYSDRFESVKQSPRQLHQQSDKPHVIKTEIWQTIQLFGLEKEVSINRKGLIRTEIQKVEYFYVIDEYDVIANHRQVRLCYDMEDLTEVYIFENSDDPNRAFLCMATEQRRLQQYGPNKDIEGKGAAKERLNRLEKRRKDHLKTLAEAGDEVEILLAGLAAKDKKATAESGWLEERTATWKDTGGKPRILNQQEEDDDELEEKDFDLIKSIRKSY